MSKLAIAAQIRALGLVCRWDGSDFRVSFPVAYYMARGFSMAASRAKSESTAYYTPSEEDALDTARAMLEGELV